ncbi:MAG: NAD(P)/FAD-dependent oxidoreductase [Myxococcaceae bacterium]
MSARLDAVVVGSGPNGLSAAIALARSGRSVKVFEAHSTPGGGARSAELTLPGFTHDICSAIHPMAAGSPFFKSLELERFGLKWLHPEIPFGQTLEHGACAAYRSLEQTAAGLGEDGDTWRSVMKPFVDGWEDFKGALYDPMTKIPKSPLLFARFGLHAIQPAVMFASQTFEAQAARALFAGCAAHSLGSLYDPITTSFGLALALQAHTVGWPAPEGGTQKITDALVKCLQSHGGEVVTSTRIRSLRELPESKAVLFDCPPALVSDICGDALPPRYHRSAKRFRRGPAVFKLDYALSGPVPWSDPLLRKCGTVHVGASLTEIAESEAAVADGRPPERPFLLVAQHSLFDPTRAPPGQHTLWVYAHLPNASTFDMTERIEAQLERFAPGFKSLVLKRVSKSPAEYEAYNPSFLGGDISAGAIDLWQLVFRPRPSLDPWSTPNPKVFLCGQSTPPGPAVHGMCGYWAAQSALKGVLA